MTGRQPEHEAKFTASSIGWRLYRKSAARADVRERGLRALRARLCHLRVVALVSLCVGLAVSAASAVAAPYKPAQITGTESLRIGTFNTYLLSPIFHTRVWEEDGQNAIRARNIGRAICSSSFRYDVIALNEVWRETYKDIIREELEHKCKRPFPYGVYYAGGSLAEGEAEDSGLMLFSRLPLETFKADKVAAAPISSAGGEDAQYIAGPTDSPFGAYFTSFGTNCSGIDCRARKGAILVRVVRPKSRRHYDIVFTHLNADDDPASAAARRRQFGQVRSLFDAFSLHDREDDVAVLMGDLNVRGEHSPPAAEWMNIFSKKASVSKGFFAGKTGDAGWALRDVWWYRQPRNPQSAAAPADLGRSQGGTMRLDYVMPSNPRNYGQHYCAQHSRLAFKELSDHRGLNLDLNLWAPQCSPRDAALIDAEPGKPKQLEGHLHYPGSVQWWRVDEPGTWSFGFVRGPGIVDGKCVDRSKCPRVELYEASNMSDPLAGFHGETKVIKSDPDPVIATKYALPEPPILVKVFVPRRSASGGRYVLAAERSSCSGIEDTCALRPAYEIPSGAPTDKPLNEADTAWFSLHPDVLTSGGTQRMGFDVITSDPGTFRMELLDKTGTLLGDAFRLDGGAPLHMDVDRHRGGEPLLLTVKRWGPVNGKFPSFAVRWTTNLKRLYGTMSYNLAVGANDEVGPDWSGDDEITIAGLWDFRHEVKIDRYQDVDTNDQLPVPEFGTVTYADEFSVKLTESSPGQAAGLSTQKTIPDLSPLEPRTQDLGELITLTAPFGDGLYTFKYRITHEDPYKQSTAMSQASAARVRVAQSPASATPSSVAPVAQNLGATQIAFSTMARPSEPGAVAWGSFDLGRMSGSPVAEELAMVATPLDDAGPALSPNGNDVVFAARGRGASRLLISSVTGAGRTRALTRGDAVDGSPAWSPDGRTIVFRREDARGHGDLFVVKSTGGRARRITSTAADESSPSWAPNGHSIVFARLGQRRRTSTLHIFDFRTRRTRPLLAGRGSKSQPDWSPDGKTIAFTRGDAGGESDIWTMDVATKKLRRLTNAPGPDRDTSWSPSGDMLAFTSARVAGYAIYTMRRDGTHQQRLTDETTHRMSADWGLAPGASPPRAGGDTIASQLRNPFAQIAPRLAGVP